VEEKMNIIENWIKCWRLFFHGIKNAKAKRFFYERETYGEEIFKLESQLEKLEESKDVEIPKDSFLMLPVPAEVLFCNVSPVTRVSFRMEDDSVRERIMGVSHRYDKPYIIKKSEIGQIANALEIGAMMKFGFFRNNFQEFLLANPVSAFLSSMNPGIGFQNPFLAKDMIESPNIRVKSRIFLNDENVGNKTIVFINSQEL
jgi:hypothetical protein